MHKYLTKKNFDSFMLAQEKEVGNHGVSKRMAALIDATRLGQHSTEDASLLSREQNGGNTCFYKL